MIKALYLRSEFRPLNFLFLLALTASVQAVELSDSLTFHGFGSLGFTYNNDDDTTYLRNIAQPGADIDDFSFEHDSRLGLQLNYQPGNNFSAALQAVSKYRYDRTFTPDVSWAYVKYNPDPDLDLRAGRLGLDIFFRSDSRDIGYSYLWARPPVDYYGQLNVSRFDGLDINRRFTVLDGILRLKGFYGEANEKFPAFNDSTVDFGGSRIYGLLGEYQDTNWTVKLGVSQMELGDEGEDPAITELAQTLRSLGTLTSTPQAVSLASDLEMRDKNFTYYSLGIAYDEGPWRTQFAISHIDTETLVVPDNDAAYLSIGYNIDRWTPYLLLSYIKSEKPGRTTGLTTPPVPAPDLALVDALVAEAQTGGQVDQQTLAIGARYDFDNNMALKMQMDYIHSEVNPSLVWYVNDNNWDGDNVIFSVTLDFVF